MSTPFAKSNLFAFMNAHRSPKGSAFTHTSLANPTGTFFVPPQDQLEFNRLYKAALQSNKQDPVQAHIQLHLTERPPPDACQILVDIDLRYTDRPKHEIVRFSDTDITTIIKIYHVELSKHYPVPKETRYFVTYKPGPRVEPHTIKDGWHVVSPDIIIPLTHQLCLRDRIIAHPQCIALFKDKLMCSNAIEDVIDRSVYKSQWFMYGSGKENQPPHRVKRIVTITSGDMLSPRPSQTQDDTNQPDFTMDIANPNDMPSSCEGPHSDADYFDLLSLRTATPRTPLPLLHPWSQPLPLPPPPSPTVVQPTASNLTTPTANVPPGGVGEQRSPTDVAKYVSLLSTARADAYDSWMRVGWALYNTQSLYLQEDLLALWTTFSQRSAKFKPGECAKLWSHMEHRVDGVGIASVRAWASEDNPLEYAAIMMTTCDDSCILSTDDIETRGNGMMSYEATKHHFERFVYRERTSGVYVETLIDGEEARYITKHAFMDAFNTLFYTSPTKKEMVPFIPVWIVDPRQRKYDKAVFAPPGGSVQVTPKQINMWKGTAAERLRLKGVQPTPGGETVARQHILHLMGNNEIAATYIEMWIAQILQQPGYKPGVALILIGPMGCGKSVLAEDLMTTLLGKDLCSVTCQSRELFEKFSVLRYNKVYINLDETSNGALHADSNALKGFMTQRSYTLERKYECPRMVFDYCRYIITTNNEDGGMKPEEGSNNRRAAPLGCSDILVGNTQYFIDFHTWMTNDGNILALYDYFMTLDVASFDFSQKPQVQALQEFNFKSLPTAIKYLVCSLNAADPDPSPVKASLERVSVMEFRDKANAWVDVCITKDKVVGLAHIGARSITKGLADLIHVGAVRVHKGNGTMQLTFDWAKTAASLAMYLQMNDMY